MPNDGNWWSRTDDTAREDETFSPFVRGQGLGSARADFGSGVSDPFVPLPWSRETETEMEESAFEGETEGEDEEGEVVRLGENGEELESYDAPEMERDGDTEVDVELNEDERDDERWTSEAASESFEDEGWDTAPVQAEEAPFDGEGDLAVAGEDEGEEEGEESFEQSEWGAELELDETEYDENEWERAGADLDEAETGGAVRADSEVVAQVPLLRRHKGIGPDLILTWNDMASAPSVVDVVVHLHGFSLAAERKLDIQKDLKPRSGLDWSDPQRTDAAPGRARPTLALLPRGSFYGGSTKRGYHFPALTAKGALRQLVEFSLARFASRLGVPGVTCGRLILTAHSGGGAALMQLLKQVDPHEVHVFDGLYGSAAALVAWARRRIARDRRAVEGGEAVSSYMPARGGALRVLYGGGTAKHSLEVAAELRTALPADSPLRRWYRVERTSAGHVEIPPRYGWRLLADASADLPGVPYVPARPKRRSKATKEAWEQEDEDETFGTFEALDEAEDARSDLRERIVAVAKAELALWSNGMKENEPRATPALQRYHKVGVGADVSAADLQNKAWHNQHPWSAVFISYVMREAGAGDAFEYARAHTKYVCAAKRARDAGNTSRFMAYRIDEARPEVGDLVCRDRVPFGKKTCAGTTFDTVCKGGSSHCDIVIEVDRANNRLRVIGGNVNQNVDDKFVPLTPDGYLQKFAKKGACPYIAVIKPPGAVVTPAAGSAVSGAVDVLASLPQKIADAVRGGAISLQVALAIMSGQRDPNTLTNMLFYARHPELPAGYKLKPTDRGLVAEWISIRDGAVASLLRSLGGTSSGTRTLPVVPATTGAAADAPPSDLGTLQVDAPGFRFRYPFTANDALWTARFIVGEAGGRDDADNQAVIWAMLNRYALFTHGAYPSFERFIRAYSTTLQPVLHSAGAARRHMNSAEFVRTGGTYPGTDVPKGQLRRHLTLQATPWSRLPASARALAQRALRGEVANPIGVASEFASTRVYFHDHHKRWPTPAEWRQFTTSYAASHKPVWTWVGDVAGLDQSKNAFFIDARAAALPRDSVRVVR